MRAAGDGAEVFDREGTSSATARYGNVHTAVSKTARTKRMNRSVLRMDSDNAEETDRREDSRDH
jgi:hypothetical protein